MPTFIPLMPEGAIIRATDPPSSRPTKSRVSGTASQNVTLDFPEGMAASAIWRILLPSQNRMGVLTSDDLEVVLRYTSQDASGGNVGWQVEAAIADQGDPFDNVTAASFSAVDVSTNQAYAGAIADEQENTVTLAGLFTGIDTAKNYTLFIKITRRTVGGDLVGGVSLLPSFLVVQSEGKVIRYLGTYNANTTLTAANIRNTLLLGDTSAGTVDLELPTLTSAADFLNFAVVREGGYQLRLLSPDPAYRIIYPNYIDDQTYEMNTEGDSVSLVYVHAVQTYYVIG